MTKISNYLKEEDRPPFENISSYNDAGMIVTNLFLTELFNHQLYEPVEYGDVW